MDMISEKYAMTICERMEERRTAQSKTVNMAKEPRGIRSLRLQIGSEIERGIEGDGMYYTSRKS